MPPFFNDPPSNPYKIREWLINFKNYVIYGETAGATAPANQFFGGPSSGADAEAMFRALVNNDIPNLSATKITSDTLDNSRINWASPGALGTSVPQEVDAKYIKIVKTGAAALLDIIGDDNQDKGLQIFSNVSSPSKRWTLLVNGAESSTDTGSSLTLAAYKNDGTTLDANVLVINRATNLVTFGYNVDINSLDVTTITGLNDLSVALLTVTNNATIEDLLVNTDAEITDDLTVHGDATVDGSMQSNYDKIINATNAYLDVDGGNASVKAMRLYSGSSLRWYFGTIGSEGGSGAGNTLNIKGYQNDGTTETIYATFDRRSSTNYLINLLQTVKLSNSASIDAGNGVERHLDYTTSGSKRWRLSTSGSESSDNAGASLTLTAYDDDGSTSHDLFIFTRPNSAYPAGRLDTVLNLVNFAGNVYIANELQVDGAVTFNGGVEFVTTANFDDIVTMDGELDLNNDLVFVSSTALLGLTTYGAFESMSVNGDTNYTGLHNSTSVNFTNVITGTPSNTTTPQGWIKIYVRGNVKYLPYYA